MLQCRSGKRTGQGAVKIAVEMVNEGLVDISSAIKMVEPGHLDQLLHPQVHKKNITLFLVIIKFLTCKLRIFLIFLNSLRILLHTKTM